MIEQGEVYWIEPEDLVPPVPGVRHLHVVVQEDVINHSRVRTVVVCGLTSNPNRMSDAGNVLLDVGEAGLPKQSIVVASQVCTVRKDCLGEPVGRLSEERIRQVLAGMRFVQRSFAGR